jgi:hypothetical protein
MHERNKDLNRKTWQKRKKKKEEEQSANRQG